MPVSNHHDDITIVVNDDLPGSLLWSSWLSIMIFLALYNDLLALYNDLLALYNDLLALSDGLSGSL